MRIIGPDAAKFVRYWAFALLPAVRRLLNSRALLLAIPIAIAVMEGLLDAAEQVLFGEWLSEETFDPGPERARPHPRVRIGCDQNGGN
jgi:hypothetical protein